MFNFAQRLGDTCSHHWLMSLFVALVLTAQASSQDTSLFIVVGNAQAEGVLLRHDELRDLILGRKRTLPDGHKVALVFIEDGAANAEFVRQLTGKSAMQFKRHWRQLVFAGKGVMPRFVKSESELLEFVRTEEGALGAVSRQAILDGSVCVIPVDMEVSQ